MHSLVEKYLSEVAAHLRALPAKRRDEELREMRTHLENAVIVNREQGQTEDGAAQAAVAQFGTPKDLGENVVWAWRCGRGDWRDVLRATGCILLLMAPYVAAVMLLVPKMEPLRALWNAVYPYNDVTAIVCAGAITGWAFPKRAVVGTALGMVVLLAVGAICCRYGGIPGGFFGLFVGSLWTTKACWPAVLGAWAGSRWRGMRRGRARRARS